MGKNHRNRAWRTAWTVDLSTATATHRDGWVFQFAPDPNDAGAFDGECISHPQPLTQEHMQRAARIAREAGDVYIEARANQH